MSNRTIKRQWWILGKANEAVASGPLLILGATDADVCLECEEQF